MTELPQRTNFNTNNAIFNEIIPSKNLTHYVVYSLP